MGSEGWEWWAAAGWAVVSLASGLLQSADDASGVGVVGGVLLGGESLLLAAGFDDGVADAESVGGVVSGGEECFEDEAWAPGAADEFGEDLVEVPVGAHLGQERGEGAVRGVEGGLVAGAGSGHGLVSFARGCACVCVVILGVRGGPFHVHVYGEIHIWT